MRSISCRHGRLLRLWLVLASVAVCGEAFAQRTIGAAITVEHDVSGLLAGRNRSINTGDGVFSNEKIRTADASAAQLQFLDQTKLRIGPSASVVLDRFIYNPDGTAREAAVDVTDGAARWEGGKSNPGAYRVQTPHAAIAVRGTVFDLLVERQRTIVTLREGVIAVCPIQAPQRCVTLDRPGQVVTVTATAIGGPFPAGPSETRFAELCLRPIDRAACSATTTVQLAPVPYWSGFYAGVHRASTHVGGNAFDLDVIDNSALLPTSPELQGLGAPAGVQGGYLWQFGTAVLGFEADLSATGSHARAETTLSQGTCLF